jgi:small subunit ribosomal protein S1
MDGLLDFLSKYGVWGLLAIAIILFIVFYEKFEKPIARLYWLLSLLGKRWRRRAIQTEIQSNINSFSRSVNKEVPKTMPYGMKLKFVTDIDRAELLQGKGLILVRIKDRIHDDKNLVHSMLTFCPVGVLPDSRMFLDGCLSDGVDYTVTRKLLSSMRHQSALNYLHKEIVEPAIKENPDLDKVCRILDHLDEQGLFTKVLLRELRDFGAKVASRYPTDIHRSETRQFVNYMDAIANRAPHEVVNTEFQGNYISIGFVFIGTDTKIQQEGAVPYLRSLQWKKSKGLQRAYIAARDWAIDIAERISYLAEKKNLAKIVKHTKYYATDSSGQRREHVIIEMQLIVSPFAPPEQGILLED